MKFIGRKSELSKLEEEYNRDSSFVVIYGRRRVGKTTLIKEFLKEKTAFYFLAIGRRCGSYNKKYITAKNYIYRLVGFVPSDC